MAAAAAGELAQRLRALPDVAEVLTRPGELFSYESDGLTLERGLPLCVAFPTTTEAVAAIVRVCNEAGVPYVPRGAGTGLSGGATPVTGGVVIECARMDRVLEIDATNRTATVQPGVINEHLSQVVRPLGLFYAPDPSSQSACTIGGNVAENSGGPHTLKYGTTSPHVLELEVVLPDASVVRLGRRDGHAHGYDLRGVFVGSEGTLGIVCAATVRLLPLPETVCTLLAGFTSLRDACAAVSAIIARGIVPSALELLDDRTIDAVEASVYAAGYPRDARAVLLVELDGVGGRGRARARAHRRDPARAARDRGARRARRGRAARAVARPQGRVRRDGPARARPVRARRGGAAHASSPTWSTRSTARPRRAASGSRTSCTPATATCTRTSPSTGAIRSSCARSASWAARSCASASTRAACSRASTASGSRSATTCA